MSDRLPAPHPALSLLGFAIASQNATIRDVEQTKECRYCGRSCPEESFGVALTTPKKVYRRRKCRDCYRNTKQALILRHYDWLSSYKKAKGCARCGIKDPRVLDFHHRSSEDKLFTIGSFRREVG